MAMFADGRPARDRARRNDRVETLRGRIASITSPARSTPSLALSTSEDSTTGLRRPARSGILQRRLGSSSGSARPRSRPPRGPPSRRGPPPIVARHTCARGSVAFFQALDGGRDGHALIAAQDFNLRGRADLGFADHARERGGYPPPRDRQTGDDVVTAKARCCQDRRA